MITNGQRLREISEKKGVRVRTLDDVKSALAQAKKTSADAAMARLMLRHGRLTTGAREWIEREYPQ